MGERFVQGLLRGRREREGEEGERKEGGREGENGADYGREQERDTGGIRGM